MCISQKKQATNKWKKINWRERIYVKFRHVMRSKALGSHKRDRAKFMQ